MLSIASLASRFAEGFGLAAAAIAVCGFIAHVPGAIAGASERRLRRTTVIGGVGGLGLSVFVVVLSVLGVA